MTLDFDRYLSYTDPDPESCLDHQIQKAYREWGSFCYLAYDRCSSEGAGRGERPRGEGAPDQDLRRQQTNVQSLPVHQYILNSNNNYTTSRESSPEQYHYGYNTYHGYSSSSPDLLNVEDNMPRPPGQSFGSRLSWIGNGKSQSLPACPEGPLSRRRKSPALGVSGLKCGSTIIPLSDERLPKRAVKSKFARTSLTVTSCQRTNGILEYSNLNREHVTTTEQSHSWDYENNLLETCTQKISSNVSSVVLAPVCDDVIEEVGSEEETISEEEIPELPRSRRISFADEKGETLVQCRWYEPESDMDLEDSLEEEESDENDNEGVENTEDVSSKPKRFTVLADEAYRSVCNDIQNVKRLLRQNREFFRSLAPQDEGDVNGNKSLSPSGSDEEVDECVVFPPLSPEVVPSSLPLQGDMDSVLIPQTDCSSMTDIPTTTESEENSTAHDVINGLSNQEKSVIAHAEAHISQHIKEICDLLIDDHTSDCVETDLKTMRIAKPTLQCNLVNFHVPHEHSATDLVLDSIDLATGTSTLDGTITGSELCRGKKMFVRWSVDRWRTFTDIEAEVTDRKSGESESRDVYVFSIPLPVADLSGLARTMEFAIFCEDEKAGRRLWNNNGHKNFVMEIISRDTS